MSDFQLRMPSFQVPGARQPSLGNYQLQLDPELMAQFRAMAAGQPAPRLRHLFLHPNWQQMRQDELNRLLRQPPPSPQPPLVPAGAGPDEARVATAADLFSAIWGIPSVQAAVNRLLDGVQRDFSQLTTGQTALVVTQAALILGGVGTAINLQDDPPGMPLSLILGRSIPVPGVDGLSFQLLHRGGQLSLSNIAGSGVSARASGQAVDNRFRGEVMITLDLQQIISELR